MRTLLTLSAWAPTFAACSAWQPKRVRHGTRGWQAQAASAHAGVVLPPQADLARRAADDADARLNLSPPLSEEGPGGALSATRAALRIAEPPCTAALPGYVPAAAAAPSRGLDRLLQAARERKKQQTGTGAHLAAQRGAARGLTRTAPRAGVVDTAAAPPANRVPWRSRLSAANATFPDTPERQHWLLQLMLSAKGSDVGRSRQLLMDMAVDGYPPGPREFHIAVAAHALAGDAAGALRVMQDQHARGGRALFETCVPQRALLAPPR
jgi:hypothetical protein